MRSEVCAILRQNGTTAVLVTHDQDEALSIADQVGVLRSGTIAQVGSPRDLYDHPVDAEIASFVGEANLVTGVAERGVVDTAFGPLALCRPLEGGGRRPVTVLVRPEQLVIATNGTRGGVPARVLGLDFHGHDATLRLEPDRPDLPSSLVARVAGRLEAVPGASVRVAASGPVEAWSAQEPPPQRAGGTDAARASSGGSSDI